ncbi:(E2-independent) E3 ubiquitin-conjugating enzyme FATS isoform X2 [Suncus etruscus]|uniref:(E2-independent) E3 ubiquitin-conjugating enzyme FATS isoform X2 n=1 Tax=Suncus etruscus TaxID=109475 RepID=UPI00210FEC81|nr:(E2-independent) E3 ubiquitin-conjugating enzyme FATS isoform X2 [Suncus etruscus]
MRRPGIPAKTHRLGGAACHAHPEAHPAFHIRSFSTKLRNYVMVVGFVRSDWLPSERRARICLLRMYQGPKTAEQPASRYEETVSAPCTSMISTMVVPQLEKEVDAQDTQGRALPVAGSLSRCPVGPRALAQSSSITISRALLCLPGTLGMKTLPIPPHQETPDSESQKGFASITITARRVGGPAGELRCYEHRDGEAPTGDPETLASSVKPFGHSKPFPGDPEIPIRSVKPLEHYRPFACTEFSKSSSVVRLRVPQSPVALCGDHGRCWITDTQHSEDRLSADAPSMSVGKGPLVFSSCVHIRVSQQGPNSTYQLDRPLSHPRPQPANATSPKAHRSVLSLHLRCSSHNLAPDGVGGTENREPMSCALARGQRSLPGPRCWSPGWQPSWRQEKPPSRREPLRASTCPCGCSVANADFTGAGSSPVTGRKGTGELGTCPVSGAHAGQLCIHIPGWSYRAGDHSGCDLVVTIQGCKKNQDTARSESTLVPPKEPEVPGHTEAPSEGQQVAPSSLTLQEALASRRPQFIWRSQARLRQLEHRAQQRKAQQEGTEGPRQSVQPAPRKHFTVPHPMSDNLFKPKERFISEKEMHLRSKRIYNNLPEVKKKREEQRKRVILQSNRLRAEVFKKQLLDQLLHRSAV